MFEVLIKSSIIIGVLLAFYKLFLERESFYAVNRFFLLACLACAFILPFISIPQLMPNQGFVSATIEKLTENKEVGITEAPQPVPAEPPTPMAVEVQLNQETDEISITAQNSSEEEIAAVPAVPPVTTTTIKPEMGVQKVQPAKGLGFWLLMVYLFGVFVLAIKLILQVINVLRQAVKNQDKIQDDEGTIINLDTIKEPCSFFSYIFINPETYDYETYERILAHERIHVKMRHSIDLILGELAIIALWFNPFVWLLRKEIEKNVEYQTDDILLNTDTDSKEVYQMSLLEIATHQRPLAITTNYNQSLIKRRILKMNSKKSNAFGYWKYAFILPLFFGLILILNQPSILNAQTDFPIATIDESNNTEGDLLDASLKEEELMLADKDDTPANLDIEVSTDIVDFVNDNEIDVESVSVRTDDEAEVRLTDSNKEEIDVLDNVISASDQVNIEITPEIVQYLITKGVQVQTVKVLNSNETEVLLTDGQGNKIDVLGYLKNESDFLDVKADLDGVVRQIDVKNHYEYHLENSLNSYMDSDDCTELMDAIVSKDYARLSSLLQSINPNCSVLDRAAPRSSFYQPKISPLGMAAELGELEMGQLLLSAKARPDYYDKGGLTALMKAAENGQTDFISLLLANGASINNNFDGHGTALTIAAANNELEAARLLIAKRALVNAQTPGVGTALIAASNAGNLELAEYLISQGANVNTKSDGTGTALSVAAKNGDQNLVRFLVANGADVNGQAAGVGSPTLEASKNGYEEIVSYLLANGANVNAKADGVGTPLIAAVQDGDIQTINFLINQGANINSKAHGVGTPLMIAAKNGEAEIVQHLISIGAEVNLSSPGVGTPLTMATQNGDFVTIDLLLENGASINAGANGVGHPLLVAANNGDLETMEYLISKGANVNKVSNGMGTALAIAIKNGDHQTSNFIIKNGAHVKDTSNGSCSPFYSALKEGQFKMAENLLAEGAPIDEDEINDLGYDFLYRGEVDEALQVFALNIKAFPNSWNVYDSFGEALMEKGDYKTSIEFYEKSIELNEHNHNGKEIVKKLKKKLK